MRKGQSKIGNIIIFLFFPHFIPTARLLAFLRKQSNKMAQIIIAKKIK